MTKEKAKREPLTVVSTRIPTPVAKKLRSFTNKTGIKVQTIYTDALKLYFKNVY